jgi:hypothetical protein
MRGDSWPNAMVTAAIKQAETARDFFMIVLSAKMQQAP